MTKVVAIMGGGDWADASVEHFVLPPELNLEAEKKAHRDWYNNVYMKQKVLGGYVTFAEWLKQKGAREPTSDELETFWDD